MTTLTLVNPESERRPDDARSDDAEWDGDWPGARRDEAGITTAEYAVGTAAGAGLALLLYAMLSGGFGRGLLGKLFNHVLSLLGI